MHINYVNTIKKNSLGITGILLLFFMSLLAFIAPVLAQYSPVEPSTQTLAFPSASHWLGTNDIGQDIFSRLIYGARTSLLIAAGAGSLTAFIGAFLGISAALAGGICEKIIMRAADILLIIPNMVVIILVAAYLRPGIAALILVIAVFGWQGNARVIRSQALSLKERAHVAAAKAFGAGNLYILFKHIIPDLFPLITTSFIYHARRAVFMEAGLAFLGISDPAVISWGTMLNRALDFSYLNNWYWLIPPGAALSITIVSFTFLGYALEETIDLRLGDKNA